MVRTCNGSYEVKASFQSPTERFPRAYLAIASFSFLVKISVRKRAKSTPQISGSREQA